MLGIGSTTYHVITQKKIAGKQTAKVSAAGIVDVEFYDRDNGRGPAIFEKIILRSDRQIESLVTTGKSTFAAPIDEIFARTGDKVMWK